MELATLNAGEDGTVDVGVTMVGTVAVAFAQALACNAGNVGAGERGWGLGRGVESDRWDRVRHPQKCGRLLGGKVGSGFIHPQK